MRVLLLRSAARMAALERSRHPHRAAVKKNITNVNHPFSLAPRILCVLLLFMSDREEMAERHGRILTELSELGASLARKVHAQAMEAETPDETATLTTAFHRISRSVRQTLALE